MRFVVTSLAAVLLLVVVTAPAAVGQSWSGCTSYDDYLHLVAKLNLDVTAKDIVVRGDYAYVVVDNGLNVVNITDPAHPAVIASVVSSQSPRRAAINDTHLFLTYYSGILVYSLADPVNPSLVSDFNLYECNGIAVAGNYLVVARANYGVSIVNIANPVSPLLTGTDGSSYYAYEVVAEGSLAYVATNYYGMRVIDFSEPTYPHSVGSASLQGSGNAIAKQGTTLAVACSNTVQFFDVASATAPILLGTYNAPSHVYDMRMATGRTWLACGGSGLVTLGTADPRYPTVVGRIDTYAEAYGLDLVGHIAYVADGSAGLVVVDSSNDMSPPVTGRWTTNQQVMRVMAQSEVAYVLTSDGRFRAIDCSDPIAPVEKSWYDSNDGSTRFALGGRYAYLCMPYSGLRVLDIGVPSQIQSVGYLSFSGVRDISRMGDKVYLAADNGLKIVDVSNPTQPILVSELATAVGTRVACDGRTAVVASNNQLIVVDVADATRPRVVGTISCPETIVDLDLYGRRVAAAAGGTGLVLIDISSRSYPVVAGIIDTQGSASAVSMSGNTVVVADGSSGIMIYDVENAAQPTMIGSILDAGGSRDVWLQADYLFSANYDPNLSLLAAPCPSLNRAEISAWVGGVNDTGKVAGVRPGATAGHDPDLESVSPPRAPGAYVAVSFQHPEWNLPLGDGYDADLRPPYDLDSEYRAWPVRVETNRTGQVALRITANFGIGTGWGPWLRDLSSGRFVGLGPDYEYVYDAIGADGDPDIRDFELIMGGQYGIPPLTPGSRDLPAGWSLVGVPLVPGFGQQTWGDVLLDDATGSTYLFSYNSNGDYVPRQGSDTVPQVDGLWVGAVTPFTWEMAGMPEIIGVAMPLRSGWNLVGYPLWIGTDVAGIIVEHSGTRYTWDAAVALGLVAGSFVDYDTATESYVATTTLTTWHGYWVAAYQSGVSLWFDYRNATTNLKFASMASAVKTDDDWALALTAKDSKASLAMGADGRATDGFDALLDLPCPPASPGARVNDITLSIDHTPWNVSTGAGFLSDFVSTGCPAYTWEIKVRARGANTVELNWDPDLLPGGINLDLFLPSTGQVLLGSLREASSCVVPLANGRQTVEVRLNAGATPAPPAPATTRLLANHPNPFNPSTMISFELAAAGPVTLQIYDASGRQVRQLAAALNQPAGRNNLAWDGRDDAGRPVAGGVYFYRLDAGGYTDTRKMTLVK